MKLTRIFKRKKLRNLTEMQQANSGMRTLLNSILVPEVREAVEDWLKNEGIDAVLIGGVAFSFYAKPRYTEDFDLLFLSDSDVPTEVRKFRAHRKGAFEHKPTGVEVEVISPESINISPELARAVYDSAYMSDGIRVASPSGIVAMKLGRFNLRDQADIVELADSQNIDLSGFPIPAEWRIKFGELIDKYS